MSDIKKKMLAAYLEMQNPPLDSVNPHFKSKFSSLKATIEAIRPLCAKHGLAYVQYEDVGGAGQHLLISKVFDENEERCLSIVEIPNTITDPQKKGIWLTYAKRQQAQADWFIVGEEDTDGEGTQDQKPTKPTSTPKPAQTTPQNGGDLVTDAQYREMQQAFQKACHAKGAKATEYLAQVQSELGFELNAQMTKTQYNQAMLYFGGVQNG